MNYKKLEDKIIILDCENFNPKHILECGQVFRYKKIDENTYEVISCNKQALIQINKDNSCYEIITNDVDYFEEYFDLKTDYSLIKKYILEKYSFISNDNKFLINAINFGKGIRILKQDSYEMIISFVISQNNNIKRIQQIIEKLCLNYGTNMGKYFAFPTLNELKNVTIEDYKKLGLGYRAEYLVEVIKNLTNFDYDNFKNLSLNNQLKKLLSIKGIGPKVADCILLFGFYQMQVFPVDTWIEKVFNEYFNTKKLKFNRNQMREELLKIFGNLSGYAQQYLFYYQRLLTSNINI